MSPEIWRKAKSVFEIAVELPEEGRAALLDPDSGIDEEVRDLVERLLRDHERAGVFLESGALGSDSAKWDRDFEVGAVVAERFRIVRRLGAGGMGVVYEATDLVGQGERVALKTIRGSAIGGRWLETQLRREVQLARRVTHRNVCRIHEFFTHREGLDEDTGEERRLCLFSMELLEGETLRGRLEREGRLQVDEALEVARQLLEGLGAAHRAGVVHGDFKPGNVILVREGGGGNRAVITDFGLATPVVEGSDPRILLGGTPAYMSPEVTRGEAATRCSDVYAYGIVAVEMLGGGQAGEWRKGVPGGWRKVISRSLERDAGKRYQTAMEAGEGLRQWERRRNLKRLATGAATILVGGAWIAKEKLAIGELKGALVVLPFQAEGTGGEYVADGMADEVIQALSRARGIRVVSRTSAFRYKNKPLDLGRLARELQADLVLTGVVRESGGQVVAEVTIASAAKGRDLWRGRVSGGKGERYRLAREIAALTAQQMKTALPEMTAGRKPPGAEAYDQYLQAIYFRNKHAGESVLRSIYHFEQAVALEPEFAEAWAGLGESTQMLAGNPIPVSEAREKAMAAAGRALELDSQLALAHQTQGSIRQRLEWKWREAEREFEEAIRLEPSNARVHHVYAGFLSDMGRQGESVREIELARALDPMSISVNTGQAIYYYFARRYDDAIRQAGRVMEMDPSYFRIYSFLAYSHLAKGNRQKAGEYFERGFRAGPKDFFLLAHLCYWRFVSGQRERAEGLLQTILAQRTIHSFYVGLIHSGAGRREAALDWLEKAFSERDPSMTLLKVHPELDGLRGESRFQKLLQAMNFI